METGFSIVRQVARPKSLLSRPYKFAMQFVRAYADTVLTGRKPKRKYRFGETRPAIYHKFDCVVELSDGSTYTRKSMYPRNEWRYLNDMRTNSLWNPTKTGMVVTDLDSNRTLTRFNERYGFINTEVVESNTTSTMAESGGFDDLDDLLSEGSGSAQQKGAKVTSKKTTRY
ncbi:mitochondrial 54S ribosomal protein bL31m [Dipodascopsis tothii]|uniref:mitochondrial 54S ribosomal protein bL31m n=1 Tax=Dipodascopsis tothii TaxID=44089 RepID=UPI0034CFB927